MDARFNAKVNRDDLETGCWYWTGSRDRGYGKLARWQNGKRRVLWAHRVAWEQAHGLIPAGLDIDHICRTPSCVNPAHLRVVSHRENVLRGVGIAAVNAAKECCPRCGGPYTLIERHTRSGFDRVCYACQNARRRKVII